MRMKWACAGRSLRIAFGRCARWRPTFLQRCLGPGDTLRTHVNIAGQALDDKGWLLPWGRFLTTILKNDVEPMQDFSPVAKLDTNDCLRLASIWHSLHAISTQISPVGGCTGIECMEADTYELHCFQTLTGTKFFVTTDRHYNNIESFLKRVYELYSDYALKSPFYEVEMPIRCELFDFHLNGLMAKMQGPPDGRGHERSASYGGKFA
eukprot:jgi/Mesvir1/11597/Mv00008-RA.1